MEVYLLSPEHRQIPIQISTFLHQDPNTGNTEEKILSAYYDCCIILGRRFGLIWLKKTTQTLYLENIFCFIFDRLYFLHELLSNNTEVVERK